LLERVPQRTAGDGEDDRERNDAIVQLQIAHHVELGDRTLELRIDHLLERLQDLVAIDLHAASVAPTCQAGGRLWAAKRAPMTSESKSWPLLDERAAFATASLGRAGRRVPRSAWLLTGLAFLCGGLVSAAAFSIGWRHQAQRNTAAQSALAAANTRARKLERTISGLRTSLGDARGAAARARAAAAATAASGKALARAGANVAEEADVSSGNGAAISSRADALTAAA